MCECVSWGHEGKCDRRAALVRTRVNLINAVRFTLKSLGYPVRNPSSESFHKTVLADVPAECLPVIQPVLTVLAQGVPVNEYSRGKIEATVNELKEEKDIVGHMLPK